MTDRRPRSTSRAVLAALFAATLAGCATQAVQPVYYPPPQRPLTIYAQQNQSQRQQDRDKADCQSMAASQASSSEGWANLFIGCMGGRGYRVE
ncbi:MAG TPA: hypothetical protein VGR62_11170 [Candidatus Binatia bacterium]|jgi:predicted small lipoprotein YifL|nr:hypothetical protein [Candidatus Binatia bacterium]